MYAGEADAPDRMVGDINLFLTPWEGDEDGDGDSGQGAHASSLDGSVNSSSRSGLGDPAAAAAVSYCNGEVDIMIADRDHRGKGLGISAVSALLRFIRRHRTPILAEYGKAQEDGGHGREGGGEAVGAQHRRYVLKDLVAKINAANAGSIALFTRLGFKQKGGVNYFGEIEMVLEGFGGILASLSGAVTGDDETKGDAGADADADAADYREMAYDRSRLNV